jgi:hypothetical protein
VARTSSIFGRPKTEESEQVPQYLVNHANQGVVNHAHKSGGGDGRLTRLFKSKRTACG